MKEKAKKRKALPEPSEFIKSALITVGGKKYISETDAEALVGLVVRLELRRLIREIGHVLEVGTYLAKRITEAHNEIKKRVF